MRVHIISIIAFGPCIYHVILNQLISNRQTVSTSKYASCEWGNLF